MSKKPLIFIYLAILTLVLSFSVSAVQVCQSYDDFTSGSLDTNKWIELPGSNINNNLTDEHLVQNGVYHTAQLTEADKGTLLKLLNNFSVGDILEYDVNYVNGSGNRESSVKIDNNTYSIIGFWNSIEDAGVGNDLGLYHVKINFTEEGLNDEITLPNGTITFTRPDGVLPSPGLNHTFGVITRTGNNGLIYMDYDNFVICIERDTTELENRVSILEGLINSINTLIDEILLRLDNHEQRIETLENQNNLNTSSGYFKYLSYSERKNIVCGYASDNHLANYTDLEVNCLVKYRNTSRGEVSSCRCKAV
ncbi:MAG: hypothetical protein AABX03_02175 [Nanoarchaeota archaeon]